MGSSDRDGDPGAAAQRALACFNEAIRCRNLGMGAQAIAAAQEAVGLYRELAADQREAALLDLADSLNNLGIVLGDQGLVAEGLRAKQEAVDFYGDLVARNRNHYLHNYALGLYNIVPTLSGLGRYSEALRAAQQALALYRELLAIDKKSFLPRLAGTLHRLGAIYGLAGNRVEAVQAAQEAVDLYRELAASNEEAFLTDLANGLISLGLQFSKLGRNGDALQAAQEAVELGGLVVARGLADGLRCLAGALNFLAVAQNALGHQMEALRAAQEALRLLRQLAASGGAAFQSDLAMALNNVAGYLVRTGRLSEGVSCGHEAIDIYRKLAQVNPGFAPDLATALMSVGHSLGAIGRHDDALAAANEAASRFRQLAHANPQAFNSKLAAALTELSLRLGELGRRKEAVDSAQQATALLRMLMETSPEVFIHALAGGLINLSLNLRSLNRVREALRAIEEATALLRHAAQSNSLAVQPDLAIGLDNLANSLSDVHRPVEALAAAREASEICRRLVLTNPGAFLPVLARVMSNLGNRLLESGLPKEALSAAEESASLFEGIVQANPAALSTLSATSYLNLGAILSSLGSQMQSREAYRKCGRLLLVGLPADPHLWSELCRSVALRLDNGQDLGDFLLPLLSLLTEHRELAWNSEHAEVFLDLQVQVALRVWDLLATLPADDGELLDEAVTALVATLHSPDLARWLEARGSGDGPLAKLAELKREVIEAEQLLAALRKGLPGGGDAGWRAGLSGAGTEAQHDALMNDIDRQSARAQALRQAFRNERARLVAEDPRFASAFEPVTAQTLRSIAGHAQGGALLCVLEFDSDGTVRKREASSPKRGRCVAALLHTDGRRTQLLDLASVHELAWHAQNYRPEVSGVNRRGSLRGAPAGATRSVSVGSSPPPFSDLLAARMSESFWAPLQQALHASGVAVERLHVCLHGTMQQLPLGLRQAADCLGLQVIPWPGLPYLRRAAMATTAKSQSHTGTDASAPWLVGHDCAWGSAQPLPMVAAEAALLRDLLQRHGQPVQPIRLAAQLHGQASALVACCHGGAEQAQFDHALHLGSEPLTVRQIVQENIGPPLALLPACHAGRTDEDAAGNALGVAAAFMLSGTQVVAASSKAVPDLLQPWLSTLTVWHAMQGLPHHEAATLAREQFARLDFPAGYRSWLQQALPQALATIQPGGEEDQHIRGVHAQTALEQVEERWPWEGETTDLFSADPVRREEATRSVVQGILVPRGGEAGAHALAAEAREMAAFVFVYGVARNDAGGGIAAGTAASAEPTDAARPDQHAAQPRPQAELAPSTPRMAENVPTRPVPDQPKAKPPASGLLGRLGTLIGR